MSDYKREKVLRIPREFLDMSAIEAKLVEKYGEDWTDDRSYYLETAFPDLFDYSTLQKFQFSPTEEDFIDYVLESEYGADCGDWGKVRELYEIEKLKYRPIFQQIDPNVNMDKVRLVEYCWYNATEAPDYYDNMDDPFYKEV